MSAGPEWLDDQAGPLVRPYTMTRGRVTPVAGGFDLVAYVVANPGADPPAAELQPEHHRILAAAAAAPVSVAELASHLNLALGVVRVLLGDLLADGQITVHQPAAATHLPDEKVLKAVINGLRTL